MWMLYKFHGCSWLGFCGLIDFLSKWSHLILWMLFMNYCKCICSYLVVVVHSLYVFLNQVPFSKLLEDY
jgi:hypothetical protein